MKEILTEADGVFALDGFYDFGDKGLYGFLFGGIDGFLLGLS